MARIRTIKPEFWTNEKVMELSPMARLLFIGLWNFCDDKVVHPVAFKTLKAEVFPADDILSSDIERLIQEVLEQGLLSEFSAEGRLWWHVTGWHHQLINRPSKSRYPSPPRNAPLPEAAGQGDSVIDDAAKEHTTGDKDGGLSEDSLTKHGGLNEDSLTEGKGDGGEGKGRDKPTPPSPKREVGDSFSMDLDWQPSPHFPTLAHQSGLPDDEQGFREGIAEFKSYWLTRSDTARTQHEWDHTLLTSLKAGKVRKQQGPPAKSGKPSRHTNFDQIDYREGISPDGRF